MADNPQPQPTPQIQASFNWGALFRSPLFWGVVIGVAGTIITQQQWKKRKQGSLNGPRREPRLVNPE